MFSTHFGTYVCEGDSIACTVAGIDYTARLVRDEDGSVDDNDCYTAKNKAAWRNDEWHFFGVVLSASKNGVHLGELASLWAIEGNFPSRRKNPNTYFLEVANELLAEAQTAAETAVTDMLAKLAA